MTNTELNEINSLAKELSKNQPTRIESINNLKEAGILNKNGAVNKYYSKVFSYKKRKI